MTDLQPVADTTRPIPPTTRLRDWRLQVGWTVEEAADVAGVSTPMLSMAERGLRQFSPHMKVLIARRYGVRVGDLFEPNDEGGEVIHLDEMPERVALCAELEDARRECAALRSLISDAVGHLSAAVTFACGGNVGAGDPDAAPTEAD